MDNRWFRKSSTQMKEVYKGKKIMIVAGGPSTNDVAWENLDYDYLWTCNYFYQNEKLKDRKVDLALLGNTVNFSNEDLKNKLNKDDSIVVIEPTHIRKTNTEEYLNFESEFKFKRKIPAINGCDYSITDTMKRINEIIVESLATGQVLRVKPNFNYISFFKKLSVLLQQKFIVPANNYEEQAYTV